MQTLYTAVATATGGTFSLPAFFLLIFSSAGKL